MRKIFLPAVFFLLGSAFLFSCKKDTENISEISKGNLFFPLEVGKYIVYDVDSTIWDDLLKAEIHHRSQMRYDVTDTFRDDAGRLSYVITIRSRPTDLDPYVASDVIYATPTPTNVVVTQKNLKFIKLTFPVANGKSWNGNAMIPLDDAHNEEYNNDKWLYTYARFDQSFDPGNNLYRHTVTVNEIDDQLNDPDVDSTAYAYKNYEQEIYAYNVGMIYRERIYWVFQPKSPDGQSGGSGYRKGYGVLMKAVDNN